MAVPTEYRSTDSSAPVITGQNGTLVNALNKILVDGYGSKSAAGWSKYTSGTDYASYRQGAGLQMYFAVVDTDARLSRVTGYEAMTDATSGTNPFPTSEQVSGGLYFRKSTTADSTARPWICFATNKTIYIWIWGGQAAPSNLTGLSTSSGDPSHFGFGQTYSSRTVSDAYNAFIMAATDTSATDTTSNSSRQVFHPLRIIMGSALNGHYMPRSYAQTGTSENVLKVNSQIRSLSSSGTTSFTFPSASGALMLDRIALFGSTSTSRGYLPGMRAIVNGSASNFSQLASVDSSGSLNGHSYRLVYTANGGMAVETTSWTE